MNLECVRKNDSGVPSPVPKSCAVCREKAAQYACSTSFRASEIPENDRFWSSRAAWIIYLAMCATSAQGVAFVLFAGLSTTSTKHVVPLMFCRAAPPAQISRSVITKEELSQGPMKGRPKIKTEFLALLTKVGLGRPRVPNSGTDSGPDFSHSLFIFIYIYKVYTRF